MDLYTKDFFDLTTTPELGWLSSCTYQWEAFLKLAPWFASLQLGEIKGNVSPLAVVESNVRIGVGTVVEAGAIIKGPAIIGSHCEIRAGAYIRGNVYVGDNSVVGHGTEIKDAILLQGVRVDHFNYIRSSILGNSTRLGASAILASMKIPLSEIIIRQDDKAWPTGMEKFGAVVGDGTEVGCNAVLNPGSILGKDSIIYPLVSWRGVLPHHHIAKSSTEVVLRREKYE